MELTQQIIWKLVLAVIVGGAIGAEREYRSKSAGFRTLTLICLGATIFTILSQFIGGAGNPDRIASNIVTGIGFVGAGVIFKETLHSKVNGITTAAMIWVTAALGMGIGAGCLVLAAMRLHPDPAGIVHLQPARRLDRPRQPDQELQDRLSVRE